MKKIFLLTLIILSIYTFDANGIEDKVVAVINNEAITKAELSTYINMIKLQIGHEGWKQYGMSEKMALENLIEDRLISQEAKRKELEISDRLIEARVDEIKRKLGSEESFSEFLISQGLSLNELKERFKESMLSEKLINMEVRGRIFVSPKEVTEYYQEHIEDFSQEERIKVESIFVESRDTAARIYERLEAGMDFERLQKKYSEKSSLGIVTRGQLIKEIEDVVFNLGLGEFSSPLELSGGYYIFLLKEKLAASKNKLIEIQDNIRNILLDSKYGKRLREFVDKLKANSYIVIKDE